ncbi:MAG: hypothetical protein NTZ07_03240 [Candidatus Woesebacteria bacterium]|nr:hypothetical protein [Candidatus Woesebacteria bacterium]
MISVACLTGPFAGQTRHFEGTRSVEAGAEVEPSQLFSGFMRLGWGWSVDYSAGTEEEKYIWFRAEIVACIVRALNAGRPVRFLSKVYHIKPGDDSQVVAQKLEDDIVSSGRLIAIDSDDKHGLVIGERGYEH